MKNRKIVVISTSFYPSVLRGGPAVSTTNMVQALGNTFEISVLTSSYEMGEKTNYKSIKIGKNRLFNSDIYYLDNSQQNLFNVYKMLKKIKPDVIYVSSLFNIIASLPAMIYRNNNEIDLIISPRGELQDNPMKHKKIKKKLFLLILRLIGIEQKIVFHATSKEEAQCIEKIMCVPVMNEQIIPNLASGYEWDGLSKYKEKGFLSIMTVSRIHPIKNILESLNALARIEGEINYTIYGPLEDQKYWQECLKIIETLPSNIQVNYGGVLLKDEKEASYKNHHLTISNTTNENFGHSIVEAMFHGHPVVISDRTPWNDVIGSGSAVVPLGDINNLSKELQRFVDMSNQEFRDIAYSTYEYINKKLKTEDIIQSYVRLMEGIKSNV